MTPRRLVASTVIATAASLAALTSVAPLASADGTLSLTNQGCGSDSHGNFWCDYQIAGGTGPYTGSAVGHGYARPNEIDIYYPAATVFGTCSYGHLVSVTLTIQDSTGAVASSTATGECPKWPNS